MIEKSEALIKSADFLDIRLRDHGHAVLSEDWQYPETALPMSRLYFCKSDGGVITYGKETVRVKKDFVYLLPAGLKFGYRVESEWEKLFVHFIILRRDGYDMLSELHNVHALYLGEEKMSELFRTYTENNPENAFAFKSAIYETVNKILCESNFTPIAERTYSKPVENAIKYVRSNLSIKLSIPEIAQGCFISASLLSKRFKNEYGIPLGRYIDDMVFFKAQNLLIESTLSISEISDLLGFCDQFYFSRRFRMFSGISPRYYRKYRY